MFVINCLLCMLLGWVWEVLCEDEIVCCLLGLSLMCIKLIVFIISVVFVGFVGMLFVVCQGFVSLEFFIFVEFVFVLVIVVLGGMGL